MKGAVATGDAIKANFTIYQFDLNCNQIGHEGDAGRIIFFERNET